MRFTITQFREKYPDEAACLRELFQLRYGDMQTCPSCNRPAKFHQVTGRKCLECQWCGKQLFPMVGTIFEGSSTPLSSWFYAMYLMTATRSGVAAKELERQLGITYKTAWRMAHAIRSLMAQDRSGKLSGTVEVDETYIGGKRPGKRGRGAAGKAPVVGIVERGGRIRATAIPDVKGRTLLYHVDEHVEKGSTIMSDDFAGYQSVSAMGYLHERIKHSEKVYAIGNVHTQTIEGFWSRLKNSIVGTHVWVSQKHLQKYVDEFAFRFNERHASSPMFDRLLSRVARPS